MITTILIMSGSFMFGVVIMAVLAASKQAELRDTGRYLADRNAQLAAVSQRIVASNHALLERAEKAEAALAARKPKHGADGRFVRMGA